MRLRYSLLALVYFAVFSALNGQTTIFHEDFDECILPAGWETSISGNPNPNYYVGKSTNNDQNGSSLNGSCFLFIDDDALGDQTPAYVIDIRTPVFNVSEFPTVELTLDVHYRDWGPAQEYFSVILWDGANEVELRRFAQGNSTGDSLHEFVTLKYDLALMTASTEARLIFRYDDAGGFNWWAGVDNIDIKGFGTGTNVIAEAFNQCQQPAGWEAQTITGDFGWTFGKAINPKAGSNNTMDGSCMAYFDDDILSDSAVYSTARIYTPWFDGTQFGRFTLDFDLILRYYQENVLVYVQDGQGGESLVQQYTDDVGGPLFTNYVHQQFDISAFRSQQMRVVFEYTDGNSWGWWAGVDNVKIRGEGAANDLCTQAIELLTGAACTAADNRTAIFDGPQPDCSEKAEAGLWFKWNADFTGIAKLQTRADFNDVVNIYTGGCAVLDPIQCNNRDEHGFTGETTYFNAVEGTSYLVRISGQSSGFGMPRGGMCVDLQQTPNYPVAPANDNCETAQTLSIGGACLPGDNIDAGSSAIIPSQNERARADIWYQFTAPAAVPGEVVEIHSGADFSDIITVYSGACNDLQEFAANFKGGVLPLPGLTAGQVYYVQIAGNFATVEGHCCVQASINAQTPPANDACAGATPVTIGAGCTASSTNGSSFSGYMPPCVFEAYSDVWFSFTAPASGTIRFNANADFEHIVAIWKGNCAALSPVYCFDNPKRCDGPVLAGGLSAGETYYLQIAARAATVQGNCCVALTDGLLQPEFQPLELNVLEQCNGLGTAILSINAHGGLAPYSFEGQSAGATVNSGDEYLVVVHDAMNCTQSITGIVDACTQSCALSASILSVLPVCEGPTGALNASVSGGTEPYTYNWSGGQTTAAIANLEAGTYTVTVLDVLGCATVMSTTLVDGGDFQIATGLVEHPETGQSNGNIFIDAGGNANALLYVWTDSTGVIVGNSRDLTGVPGGTYTLVATSPEGCTKTLSVTLTPTVGTGSINGGSLNVRLFPNPARTYTTILLWSEKPEQWQITISDPLGRLVFADSFGPTAQFNLKLELGSWQAGAYLVQARTDAGLVTRKLVVGN